ncbi:MAG: alpha/beta hydrolase [Pseudomonadota bacterium]
MYRWLACLLLLSSAAASAPERTVIHEDLAYADTGNAAHTLHLLLPHQAAKPVPLVISLHGGGWNRGSKDHALALLAPLVVHGEIALASVGYRLSGEAVWPAQLDDVTAAYHWFVENAAAYGIDSSRIAVFGVSAGGHLAMMLGTQPEPDIAAVISVAGPTDLTTIADEPSRVDHASPRSIGAQLVGGALAKHQEAARAASPAAFIDGSEPPHLLFHGDLDRTIPFAQSADFDAALDKAGAASTLIQIAGADHGDRMPWAQIRELTSLYLSAVFASLEPPLTDLTIPYAAR